DATPYTFFVVSLHDALPIFRLERAVPLLVADVFDVVLARLVRGVADEDVELPELGDGALDAVAADVRRRQVAFDREAAAAFLFDRRLRLLGVAFLLGQVRDRD